MLSIIIPSLHAPLIARVVASLEAQTARDQIGEIIIVGQDRDHLVPAHVTFIQTEQPLSAAAARNLGAQHASAPILLFIDSDCIAAPDLVELVLACHAQGHQIIGGGVAPTGSFYWTLCDNLLVFAEYLTSSPAGPRDSLPSLNFSIPRQLFIDFGGFDERFPGAAGEDFDFSLRLREAGYPLYFTPTAQVVHQHRRSTSRETWEHLRSFGRAHSRVASTRASLRHTPAARLPRKMAGLIMSAALPLALLDAVRLYMAHPNLCRYPNAFPGIVWAKSGWYWGLAEALMAVPKPHGQT